MTLLSVSNIGNIVIFATYSNYYTINMPLLKSTLKKYSHYYILITVISLFSCNNEDITKITAVYVDSKSTLEIIDDENQFNFEFNLKSDTSKDLTSQAIFFINGDAISNNTFSTLEVDDFEVFATYENFTSETLIISAKIPSGYSQKVLVEDYTGTWCGFCPRIAYAINQVKLQSDKIVSVAVHLHENNDIYTFEGSTTLRDEFGISGLPKGRINRTNLWQSPEPNNLEQVLDLTEFSAPLGLAISSELNNNTINATIQVGFAVNLTSNLGVVLYLAENGLIHDQTNYTNFFPVGEYVDPLVDFEHNDVLRAIYTNHLGDAIPTNETVEENIFTINFEETIPASVENTANLHLVAFIVNKDTNEVINVQEAAIGENKDFD